MRADGDKLVLSFDHADGWYVYNADWRIDVPVELAGEDGAFRPAIIVNANGGAEKTIAWKTNGRVKGRDLLLKAEGVAEPKKVRYLFNKPWTGNVYSAAGLPLGPFEASVK